MNRMFSRQLTAVIVMFTCTGFATAQVGPDVIVGDLHQLRYWGSSGDIHAYSVGTVSCNVGDEPLLWQGSTNQKPVIGQNFYRYKDGRFEQIGQSWLKWAFVALNQDLCGDCQDPGTGSLLGVLCSDPYSAGLNGSQFYLGPKSIVNPFLGDFPANHPSPGGGTIDGRLQVHFDDISPTMNPNAIYFCEGQYIAPDDAASGNRNNNASYRRFWVQGNLDVTFNNPQGGVSSTFRERPAIFAWKEVDPTAEVFAVDIPNEGRVFVGFKSTPVGPGEWNYEFAVFNLCSERAIRGVRLTADSNANFTNIGFRDVPYHSGEPFDGTDWASSTTANSIEWLTDTFANNENANALRWGTMYNFRFNADVAPEEFPEIELVMFKPGTPSSVFATLPVPGTNDACTDALPVTDGTYVFDTTDAVANSPSENACGFVFAPDLWYSYEAPYDGDMTVSLCNSSFDTVLMIYEGTCPTGPSQYIACDNDTCGLQSELTVPIVQGQTYLIRVGGTGTEAGLGELVVSSIPDIDVPNDECPDAFFLADGVTFFDNSGASASGPAEPGCGDGTFFDGQTEADIWFGYTAICEGDVIVSLCGSSFDTTLAVYDDCPSLGGTLLACNDDACDTQSELTFPAVAGQTYYVRIAGYDGAFGSGQLEVTCTGVGGLCIADTIASSAPFGGLPFIHSGDTSFCNDDYDENCGFGSSDSPDQVYAYSPPWPQIVNIDLCGSGYDTKVIVYENGDTSTAYACNDDGCPGGVPESYRSNLTVDMYPGNTYYIVIDGWGGASGTYNVAITDQTPYIPGDINVDGVLDAADWFAFEDCMMGPNIFAGISCGLADLADPTDGDVDLADFAEFQLLAQP